VAAVNPARQAAPRVAISARARLGSENDREPDPPHGHLGEDGGGNLAGLLACRSERSADDDAAGAAVSA
jgi:hypothetical protein